ncbi:MAG: LamG domain-containing protein [Planctomycetota bacterium]
MKNLSVLIVVGLILVVFSSTASANLVAHWSFDSSVDPGHDDSGNGHNGIVNGTPVTTSGQFGGNALNFDGSGDYIDVADAPGLNPTDAITITAWFKADPFALGTYAWPSLVAKYDDTQGGYDLSVQKIWEGTPQITTTVHVGPSEWITLQESPPTEVVLANIWYFTAMTYDGSELKLYRAKEGEAIPSPPISMSDSRGLATSNSPLNIGECPYNPGRYWDGLIDEVHIFNTALDSTVIEELYLYNTPEPATLLLFGLGGLALRRKRRAK